MNTQLRKQARNLLITSNIEKKEDLLTLTEAWNKGCKLYAEGKKLHTEGDKLHTEGDKLHTEGKKLHTEGDKLRAEELKLHIEGDKLRAEGDKLRTEGSKLYIEGTLIWTNTVLRIKGNIGLEYKDWDDYIKIYKTCILETGEVFEYKEN